MLDIDTLQQRLAVLDTNHTCEEVLLILHMEGGALYPFTRGTA